MKSNSIVWWNFEITAVRDLSSQVEETKKAKRDQTGRGKTFRPDLRNNPDDGACDVKLSLLKSPISVCDCVRNSD